MRQIGILSDPKLADRFCGFLLTHGISHTPENVPTGIAIWVHNEDQLALARSELARFSENPDLPEFIEASKLAQNVIRKKFADRVQSRETSGHSAWPGQRPNGPRFRFGRTPGSRFLMYTSIIIALLSNFGSKPQIINQFLFGTIQQLSHGEVWRLVTPILLHFGALHLIFNLGWLYTLGRDIELRMGPMRFAGLILFLAITSNCAEAWHFDFNAGHFVFSNHFGGLSGVVYGLFGFVWARQQFDPHSRYWIDPNMVQMMLIWFVLCWTGWMGSIANWAHTGGLVAGYLAGWVASNMRQR